MRYEAQFPAVRTSALSARRFVSDAVVNVPDEVSETIALIASELATNCVRHAASAFEIRIEQLPDRVHIEVEDDGTGDPVLRSPGLEETSGRGLQIVQALADEWGVIPKPETAGKTVWATIAIWSPHEEASDSDGAQTGATRQRRAGRGPGSAGSSSSVGPLPVLDGGPFPGPSLCAGTARHRSRRPRLEHGAQWRPCERAVATVTGRSPAAEQARSVS
jgi:anti-sigma regulatory factor (Ser/Thr protein kinase)